MSSESLADSVYDDMKWQLGESDMDLSMVYFVYSMLFSLLNRTFYFLIYLIGKSQGLISCKALICKIRLFSNAFYPIFFTRLPFTFQNQLKPLCFDK